jgi:riboflavin biosynthesis pyrimidine reductase
MMNFPDDAIHLDVIRRDEDQLAAIRAASPDPQAPVKVRRVYDDIRFPPAPKDRPYTFGSMVLSIDGKIAFHDDPQGPLIAARNLLDPDGGKADFWVLNMLRAYADCCIIGARTLQAEPSGTSHVFCTELAEARTREMGKSHKFPCNCVVSLDGTDIPLQHMIFDHPELRPMIATSPAGADYIATHFRKPHVLIGPYPSRSAVDVDQLRRRIGMAGTAIPVIVTGDAAMTDSGAFLFILRQLGFGRACIESPQYLWHLVQSAMLDEFFVNYSSVFVGGGIALGSHTGFSVNDHPHSRFLSIAVHRNGFIFTRQQLVYGLPS